MYIPHGESQKSFPQVCTSHMVNLINHFCRYVHPTRWISEKHFRSYVYHTQSIQGIHFRSYVHPTVNPGKTFSFVRTSHTVLCVGSCVKGVTITHGLPWLTVCFYQLCHTRFDEENCVALGYPSQALLLLESFAKVHDTFSRFISLLHKFTFNIEQLFANFISGT